MTTFPTTIDTYTDPTSSSPTTNPGHISQHTGVSSAIEALEYKVGWDGSFIAASHDYKLSLVTGANKALSSDFSNARNSATSQKGFTKLSVSPVSATNPIVAGDNDTRIPTQGENNALVGTYGTPSASNRYVTQTDPNLANALQLSTNQTVAGVKTFTSIPVSSAGVPTTGNQLATKGYVDSK